MPRSSRLLAAGLAALVAPGCSSFLGHADDPAPIVRGPVPSRAQQPLALTVMSFRPRRAATQAADTFGFQGSVAYSSIEEVQTTSGDEIRFDGELLQATFTGRYGLGERADLEIELPFLYASAGFLDSFVEDFHELFGLPDGGRDLQEDDQYAMELRADGTELYSLDEGELGLMDVPIFLTSSVRPEDEHGPGVALRFGVELPTGSQSSGFGNGGIDFGGGILLEKSLARWTLTAGADYTVPAQPDAWAATEDYSLVPVWGWEFGSEYRWSSSVSLLAQFEWTSRRTNSFEQEEIAREIFDLGVGLAWDVSSASRLMLTFHDDLVSATGPDFGGLLVFTTGF